MKAAVFVTLKPTVLDPQGMTIHRSLASIGITDVSDVRQGKIFEIRLNDSVSPATVREQVERLAREVLANPVIEDYRIIWE
jgi:phosphoribosylformylglycinamidine synthase